MLLNIYFTLIRSVIDYFLILYPVKSENNKNRLQIIQNNSLRIIGNYKQDEISINQLHKKFDIATIEHREIEIKDRYLKTNKESGNPMLHQLIMDFKNFSENCEIRFPTPLSDLYIQFGGYKELTAEEMAQENLGWANLLDIISSTL